MLLVAAAEETGELATVLAAAQGLGAAPEALDAAERAGLVEARSARLDFRHPLVRSAVYHGAPLSRRQAAHRALARAFDDQGDADRSIWHRAAASVEPDAAVAAALEQAAERALRRSGHAAASLALERAAMLTEAEQERARRLTAAALNAWFAGRPGKAVTLYERARSLGPDPVRRADISLGRGIIALYCGAPADAWGSLIAGAAEVAPTDPDRALYMLGGASLAAAYANDSEAAAAVAECAGPIRFANGPVARFLTDLVTGCAAVLRGAYADAAPALRAALETATEADRTAAARFPALLVLAGAGALLLGDDRALYRFNHTLAARARDSGAVGLLTQAVPRLAFAEIWAGRWAAASASLRECLELVHDSGQHQVVAHLLCELALVASLRGDEPECRVLAEQSRELAAPRRLSHAVDTARWALAALDLSCGRADDALVHARQITDSPVAMHATLDRVEAAVRAGDAATAGLWLSRFEPWAQAGGFGWAQGVALHCRALLHEDPAAGDVLWARALDAHEHDTRPFERARTHLAYGEHLRRARRRVQAREHLRSALDAFETLGAALWSERARVELRASGQTARRGDVSLRDELTAQELQISQFVARGLSNRDVAAQLFLSPRTVDFHLRNVFRKLGIASRAELAQLGMGSADSVENPRRCAPDGTPALPVPPV
jgi:DNA-binding CsgD family transcriptional regulator